MFLIVLAGFVATEKIGLSSKEERQVEKLHPNDAQLFGEFLDVLPSKTFIEFLKQHDFLLDFRRESVEPLNRFINEWDNAEHEFQDPELEGLRKLLMIAGNDLRHKISKYTSPNYSGRQAVRVDKLKHIEEHEERFRNEAGIINTASGEFVRIHQKLVRKGRI